MSAKISVILPVYNVEKHISDALYSLINQSLGQENLEIILIDDCSTDRSGEVIKTFKNKFSNLKYIKLKKNSGSPGKPRNIGVKNSVGEFIYFMDPDDILDEYALETLLNSISDKDDFSMGALESFNEDGRTFQHITFKDYKLKKTYVNTNIEQVPFFAQLKTGVVLKLIRRKFYVNNNISFTEDMRNGEDKIVDALLYSQAKSFTYIPYVVYRYRNRNSEDDLSLTHQEIKGLLTNDIKAFYLVRNHYSKNVANYFLVNVLRSIFWQLLSEEFLLLERNERLHFLIEIRKILIDYDNQIISYYMKEEEPIIYLISIGEYNLAVDYIELLYTRKVTFYEGYNLAEKVKWKNKFKKSKSHKLYKVLKIFKIVKGE